MNLRKGILLVVLACAVLALQAQQTTVFTEANLAFKRGIDLFNQGVYGLAQKEFKTAMDLLRPVSDPEWRDVKMDAELFFAKCAVRLGQPEAEVLVIDLLRDKAPSPIASQAALEIGDYYFNAKKYEEALSYYDMAPGATGAARDEIEFKKGYSYFVLRKFTPAKIAFSNLKENTRSEWYYPANYYYGCCTFFEGRYDDALKAFARCEKSEQYRRYTPYYQAQIYFAKKQYDQLIAYAAPKARDNSLKNQAELNQLIGKSWFEKKEYAKALPYLEFGANNGAPLSPGDYYQLGYAQYQAGYFKQAIQNFEQLTKQDSLLGQNGLYHLGDCYLRTNNKFAARNAFGQAASLNLDPSVREDALINYAKLSYELKYDREALTALQKIPANSKYYDEAQSVMGDLFLNTRDYDRAIVTLESYKNRNQKLNQTYQQLCYLRGLQLYQNNMKDEARRYFNKSLDFPIDKKIAGLCSFWMGVIANESKEYSLSKSHMSAFLTQASGFRDLPEESSMEMGQYVQGYNYLKLNDFTNALTNFKACVEGLKNKRSKISSDQIKTGVLGDAILRAGDCHFKRNQYREALVYYNEAISRKAEGFEYALYQKAVIKGLQGAPTDKIIALEDLVEKFPNSRYADEALYQLGVSYQEINNLNQAIPPLKRLVADFRGRSSLINQALLRLGLISYNLGNTSAAINYYKQVFTNNPENTEASDAKIALEEIYVKELNKPQEYLDFLETVPGYSVSTASRDSVTYASAEIQFQNGRYTQAIEGFTTYIGKFPNGRYLLPAYFYRAESYNKSGAAKDLALKDYSTVVGKGQSKYYLRAAEAATNTAIGIKQYDQAFEMGRKWEEAAANDQSRLDAQVKLLTAAYLTKNSVAVGEYGRKVTGAMLASTDQIALANYYMGKIAYDQGSYTQANSYLRSVIQQSTSEIMAESYHLLTQILFKQKRFDEAEEMVSTANQASAGYDDWIARNLILLSDVYVEKGDKNSAMAALEAVLENYRGSDTSITATARDKYNRLNTGAERQPLPAGTKGFDLLEMDERN